MTPGEDDSVAADWAAFRDRTAGGRSAEVMELANRIIATVGGKPLGGSPSTDDPASQIGARRVAQAMIEKLVALLNMGEFRRLGPLMDEIHLALRGVHDPRLYGEFRAIAGAIAFEHGSLSTAMTNLVRAERDLHRMTEVSLAAVDAWHDLSAAYSACGFHTKAMEAQREATHLCAVAGLPPAFGALVEARVRAAVGLDQRGDVDGCVRELETIMVTVRPMAADLDLAERVFLRYASLRLAALRHAALDRGTGSGQPPSPDLPEEPADDLFLADVNRLADVCAALADDDAMSAIRRLDEAPRAIDVLGTAEPLRLRSLALAHMGDAYGALSAERETLRVIMAEDHQLRELLTDSISARLDQDRLRRVAIQFAGKAFTDPLTGLPNRRRTAEVAAGLARNHTDAMLGILDLDGFKAVNDTHGHPSGDLVLQRIAGIFARTVRPGDLLARHGGDEFIVILPKTTTEDAEDVGKQIRTAVGEEDWSALVPGTPVMVTIGWAPLAGDFDAAVKVADQALYRHKRAR